MAHPPTTVVTLAWNSWPTTRTCLESLRPTLGPRDRVVVVDNGSVDATPAGLRGYSWATVVTNPTNRGFAGGCNDGAAVADTELLVFLNNDTIVSPRWLDGLTEPLADAGIAAVGPRSNMVSGIQLVEDPGYAPAKVADVTRYARGWREAHRGQTTPADRLVGFCLAMRRADFVSVGGFDEGYGIGGFEDDDLCLRLRARVGRLVVADEVFVHHVGHATFTANGLDWYAEQESNRARFGAALAAHAGQVAVQVPAQPGIRQPVG